MGFAVLCSAKAADSTTDLLSPAEKYVASVLIFISLLTRLYPSCAKKKSRHRIHKTVLAPRRLVRYSWFEQLGNVVFIIKVVWV